MEEYRRHTYHISPGRMQPRLYQCQADGSVTRDPLLCDEEVDEKGRTCRQDDQAPRPILSGDEDLRRRIYERYRTYCTLGPKYADTLPAMLPQSSACVFTHADADIASRNILVDEQLLRISAILGWESAGWYPHYREHANIMGPAGKVWRLTVVYGIERRR